MRLPLLKLFFKKTDVDERITEEVEKNTHVALATVHEDLQQLRGRKIVLKHDIHVLGIEIELKHIIRLDEILGDSTE